MISISVAAAAEEIKDDDDNDHGDHGKMANCAVPRTLATTGSSTTSPGKPLLLH